MALEYRCEVLFCKTTSQD